MTILRKIASYAQYVRTVRELSALDRAQLKDIGLTRYDIKSIARASAF